MEPWRGAFPPIEVRMLSFPEVNELSDDVRRIFEEFDREHGPQWRCAAGIYMPPLDVVDAGDAVVVLVDVPGIRPSSIRVVIKEGNLIVAGEKVPPDGYAASASSFHLVERGFGRFARVVRLDMAVDAGRARATFVRGLLRVSMPRIPERRGREIRVAVDVGS